jgi:hypothetical protein
VKCALRLLRRDELTEVEYFIAGGWRRREASRRRARARLASARRAFTPPM